MSLSVSREIISHLPSVIHYPDPQAKNLRKAASQKFFLPEEMILAGNGAIEILYLLVKLLNPKRALIPAPTFNEYEAALKINSGKVDHLYLNEIEDFKLNRAHLFNNWKNSDIIFICNPNNPTGVLTPREEILEIVSEAEKLGKFVVVDEAFMDFVPDRESYSVIDAIGKFSNLFILYSLTKFYAIPGLRLGLGFGSPELIRNLDQIRDPWNVNTLAQIAGTTALQDIKYAEETIRYVSAEKEYLYHELKSLDGFRVYRPTVNYIFLNIEKTGFTSGEMTDILGEKGILIRDCAGYTNLSPYFIRTAVKKRAENEKLIDAFKGLRRKKNG